MKTISAEMVIPDVADKSFRFLHIYLYVYIIIYTYQRRRRKANTAHLLSCPCSFRTSSYSQLFPKNFPPPQHPSSTPSTQNTKRACAHADSHHDLNNIDSVPICPTAPRRTRHRAYTMRAEKLHERPCSSLHSPIRLTLTDTPFGYIVKPLLFFFFFIYIFSLFVIM